MQIKKTIRLLSILALTVATLALTACGDFGHVEEVEDNVLTVLDETEKYIDQAKIPYKPEPIDTVTVKEDIWLGQDSFKITGGEPLPADMEVSDALTVSYAEPITLADLVVDLREMTGLKFSLDELRVSEELPDEAFQLNYTGSLSGLLDYISNKYSIWWKNRKGQISFYKMETRVFTIYALPVESSMSASLSGTPISNSNSGGSGASTTLSMSTDVKLSFWENIESGITQVMNGQGEMLIDQTSGSITVTAPPFVMQKIARYVQDLNEKLSRQVAISVKVLNVVLENTDQYGLDLSAAFKSSRVSMTAVTPSFTTPTSGTITMTLLDTNWKDSQSIIQALSTQGRTSLVTSTSVTTLNNKVAPVQVTTQENYVKETTVEKDSYSSGSGSTSVDVDTDTLNYGFTMEILPRILDNGRLIVLFSMTLTDLVALNTFSSSSGPVSSDSTSNNTNGENNNNNNSNNSNTSSNDEGGESTVVQLPKMQTRGFVQEIAMRSGSTLVLTGFETVENKTSSAGIGQPRISILGGKANANQNRSILVILLTPEILVSPLSPETRMENF